MNIEPRFEPLVPSRNDWPETATVCATPGVSRAMSRTWSITACVRCTEAESGSWTLATR
jgi:hypothetical protein